jgi:para-nitrobenzyl esterase
MTNASVRSIITTVWFSIAIGPVAIPASGAAADPVSVEGGLISGVSDLTTGVTAYKGIPFAAPPVGSLRWRSPAPVRTWQGVRRADQYGPPCMQSVLNTMPGFSSAEFNELLRLPAAPSEDCLYLNVWTAAKSPDERRPVMVWIHGGALVIGSPAVPGTEGVALARKGVVMVSINYRLGAFGFFAHPELTRESSQRSSGNYGFLDQLAALQWVQHNIRVFGGDPGNVTIFGESAGAWSVNALVASPLAKGLFRRAIGESGALLIGIRTLLPIQARTLSEAEHAGVAFAQGIGARTAKDLRARSADEILKASGANPLEMSFGATIDGWVLPDSPERVFARGMQNDVATLIGSNADEGTLFAPPMTTAASWGQLAGSLAGTRASAFLTAYPNGSDQQARASAVAYFGDANFGLQMRTWARVQRKTGKSPVYLYWFDRVAPDASCRCAPHGSEIVYAFGTVASSARPFEAVDRKLADVMSSYWVNFATTGDPNRPALPTWPAYTETTDTLLALGDRIETRPVPHKTALDFLQGFFAAQKN